MSRCVNWSMFFRELLKMFQEIHYWERLMFEIPHYAVDVYNKREDLRGLREHVLLVIRDYNRYVPFSVHIVLPNMISNKSKVFLLLTRSWIFSKCFLSSHSICMLLWLVTTYYSWKQSWKSFVKFLSKITFFCCEG